MRRTKYELFMSNEQDESLLLLEDGVNYDNDGDELFIKSHKIQTNGSTE